MLFRGFMEFDLFSVIFHLIFFTVLALILYNIGRAIVTWVSNNRAEVIEVPAKVIGKREMASVHQHNTGANTVTTYYITFEIRGNARNEFRVKGKTYGLIAEGDLGMLKFQGTRFLDFKLDAKLGEKMEEV